MDSLKFSPKDIGSSWHDDTYNIEGYDEAVDSIRDRYPDETKTEEQQKLEDLYNPDSEMNQGLLEELNNFALEEGDNLQISEDISLEDMPKVFDSEIGDDSNQLSFGETLKLSEQMESEEQPNSVNELGRYSEREIKGFNLNANGGELDDREQDIARRLKNYNLEETRDAFNEINADATLTEIFDTNGDGAFTFADMFDTHRWNNGKGITKEQDAELTDKWLSSVEDKTFGARLGSIANNIFTNKNLEISVLI